MAVRRFASFNPHTHAGCDQCARSIIEPGGGFNPHTHAGCDIMFNNYFLHRHVSIHTPTQGVTKVLTQDSASIKFQSTHPRRVWHGLCKGYAWEKGFQSTHPRRVWRTSSISPVISNKFQSTHPRRVWRQIKCLLSDCPVSIHTPTQGVTTLNAVAVTASMFQSTHPRRVWQLQNRLSLLYRQFQSTHPRRVWQLLRDFYKSIACFNPHTHAGCDRRNSLP